MNKTTAKKNVESVSRQYVNAKRSTVEYENITRGLLRGGTSIPLQGTPQETQQVKGERGIEQGRRNFGMQLHNCSENVKCKDALCKVYLLCFHVKLLIWKRYIAWEKSNPTRTEDQALMVKRGTYICICSYAWRRTT